MSTKAAKVKTPRWLTAFLVDFEEFYEGIKQHFGIYINREEFAQFFYSVDLDMSGNSAITNHFCRYDLLRGILEAH